MTTKPETLPEPDGYIYDASQKAQFDFYTASTLREAVRKARAEAFEEAAKVPRAYAQELDKNGWGNRWPDELTAIFNASTNMADRIRALATKEAIDAR